MTRSRARARTGGQPPLTPSWEVTPEALPPGYTYTGGLRTQVNADGSIGWAPHNLVRWSESLVQSVWAKNSGAVALSDTVLSLPAAGAIAINAVTTDAPAGQVFTVSVELSGSGTVSLGGARLGAGTYEDSIIQVTLTTTPTRYTVTKTVANSGQTGWQLFVTRRAATGDTATEVTMSKAIVCYGSVVQPYLLTTSAARFEPRTADYSDSMAPLLGPELVADPSFDNPASWSTVQPSSGSVVVAGGNAALTSADGSYASADAASGAPTVIGRLYRCTLVVTSTSGGGVRALVGGRAGTARTAPGTYVEDLAALSASRPGVIRAGGVSGGVVASISVREITGYAGTTRGVKIDPPSTNLLLHSETPTNAAWFLTDAVLGGAGPGIPSASMFAVSETATTAQHSIRQNIAHSAGPVTISCVAKYNGRHLQIVPPSSMVAGAFANFDLQRGVLGTVSGVTAGIVPMGDSYLCWATVGSASSGTGTPTFALIQTPTDPRVNVYAGVDGLGFYLGRMQVEAASGPTSYIPTYGSQVTRSAEQFLYPSPLLSSGTLVAEFAVTEASQASARIVGTDGPNAATPLFFNGGVTAGMWNGTILQTSAGATLFRQRLKAGSTWSPGRRAVVRQGGAVASDSQTQTIGTNILLGVGTSGSSAMSGSIYRISIYPRAANDAQFQALTA